MPLFYDSVHQSTSISIPTVIPALLPVRPRVIHDFEEHLPFLAVIENKKSLSICRNRKKHVPYTKIEQYTLLILAVLYGFCLR